MSIGSHSPIVNSFGLGGYDLLTNLGIAEAKAFSNFDISSVELRRNGESSLVSICAKFCNTFGAALSKRDCLCLSLRSLSALPRC